MVYIPPEIWLYVGSFIPDEALSQIRCVNKVFLDLAMSVRWREVTITTRNISQAMKILQRLSCVIFFCNMIHEFGHFVDVKSK